MDYTREALIKQLQSACKAKGKTPTGEDADKGRFGLKCKKRIFVQEFGTWNNAIREAGLVAEDVEIRKADLEDVFLEVMAEKIGVSA
jgi:hypothetical protein